MRTADTRIAELEYLDDHRVIVRIKNDIKIDVPGVEEVCAAVKAIVPDAPVTVLDFDIAVMRTDLGGDNCVKIMAVVSESAMFRTLVEVYLKYFPQSFPVSVFPRTQEAMPWLEEHPARRSVA
jgi:hypothetical protein